MGQSRPLQVGLAVQELVAEVVEPFLQPPLEVGLQLCILGAADQARDALKRIGDDLDQKSLPLIEASTEVPYLLLVKSSASFMGIPAQRQDHSTRSGFGMSTAMIHNILINAICRQAATTRRVSPAGGL